MAGPALTVQTYDDPHQEGSEGQGERENEDEDDDD